MQKEESKHSIENLFSATQQPIWEGKIIVIIHHSYEIILKYWSYLFCVISEECAYDWGINFKIFYLILSYWNLNIYVKFKHLEYPCLKLELGYYSLGNFVYTWHGLIAY